MAQMRGVAEAIIRQMSDVTTINTPQYKVTPPGLLNLLLNNPTPISITNLAQIREGHDRDIKLRYMRRGIPTEATEEEGCDAGNSSAYLETVVTHPLFRQISLYISNQELQKYYDDATAATPLGSSVIMAELYNRLIVKINGLLGSIDQALLTAMSTRWGKNAATGSSTPVTINFSTLNNVTLTDGIVKLIDQAAQNEIVGDLLLVGNGVANTFQIASMLQTAANSQGYQANRWQGFRWYNDYYSTPIWGANHFGVIAQGSAGFVTWNKNEGYSAGTQGNSYFFTLPVPVILADGQLTNLVFDVQLKSIDCAVTIDGNTRDRGYILYVSKHFGLFTTPTDAYTPTIPAVPSVSDEIPGDRLEGTNGLLHFVGAAS
ncbi:MAG: hypothetical protein LBS43_12535 [Prevotellaceae bacterium]|jgi:hypothetical protein|nr:hypothetical protein [Prevotellaceae bacterium]